MKHYPVEKVINIRKKSISLFAQKLITFSLFQEHFYLETQATIAVPRGEDGEMELFVSTQNPTLTQVCWRDTQSF